MSVIPGTGGQTSNGVASIVGNALNAVLWDTGSGGAIGVSSGVIQLFTGAFSGTVVVEGTNNDGANWDIIGLTPVATGSGEAAGATAAGSYTFPALHTRLRARISAYTSGTITAPVVLESGVMAPMRSAILSSSISIIGNMYLTPKATPSGGSLLSKFRLAAAATVNNTLISAGVHQLYGGVLTNLSAAVKFVKFYDKATAPVAGTDTPIMTVAIPLGQSIPLAAMISDFGMPFSLGLGIAITGIGTDADTTAVAASDVLLNLLYL